MRRPLTYQGTDVALARRTHAGKAVVVYLNRHGQPTAGTAEAWPHELRGVGWHIAAIKQAIAALPLEGSPVSASEPAAPRPLLFAHHVAAHRQED